MQHSRGERVEVRLACHGTLARSDCSETETSTQIQRHRETGTYGSRDAVPQRNEAQRNRQADRQIETQRHTKTQPQSHTDADTQTHTPPPPTHTCADTIACYRSVWTTAAPLQSLRLARAAIAHVRAKVVVPGNVACNLLFRDARAHLPQRLVKIFHANPAHRVSRDTGNVHNVSHGTQGGFLTRRGQVRVGLVFAFFFQYKLGVRS